mgnify:CR=1 FL=1
MKKTLSILLGLLLCFSMVACKRDFGHTEKIDPKRTQLYVFNYDGGVGTEWLYDIKARFEAEYKDECFEPGTDKKGVQIMIEANKNSFNADSTIQSNPNQVFFTENVPYNELVSQNLLLEISDIVTDNSTGTSLESRMTEDQQKNLTALKGKYYALPHYDGYRGLAYDVDLFEDKGLYFAAEKENGNNGFIISKTDKRSAGPDGKFDTRDDGLPSTLEEFFELCEYMASTMSITPLIFTGMYKEYTNYIIEAVFANYSGAEAVKLDYTFDSEGKEVEIITGFNELGGDDLFGATPIVEKVVITPKNGYLLKQQVGKYYGLATLKKILSDSRYFSKTNDTVSHLDAQEAFIYSKLENKPIGMLVDGSYWVNEASGAFERSIEDYGKRAENRTFGWMPLPGVVSGEVTEENASKNAAKDMVRSYAYINGNIAGDENKVKLAKLFLSYCYKLENLQKFTEITGSPRGLSYELTSENKKNMSDYELSIWDMHESFEMVRQLSTSKLFMDNERDLLNNLWTSTVNNMPYSLPYNALKGSTSAMDYFNGMRISKTEWENNYKGWFNA